MAQTDKRKIYPAAMTAVFGVTILYVASLLMTATQLRSIDSGTVELSPLGLTIFEGEKAGLSSSASPTGGFVIIAVLFVAVVLGAWVYFGRRQGR